MYASVLQMPRRERMPVIEWPWWQNSSQIRQNSGQFILKAENKNNSEKVSNAAFFISLLKQPNVSV